MLESYSPQSSCSLSPESQRGKEGYEFYKIVETLKGGNTLRIAFDYYSAA